VGVCFGLQPFAAPPAAAWLQFRVGCEVGFGPINSSSHAQPPPRSIYFCMPPSAQLLGECVDFELLGTAVGHEVRSTTLFELHSICFTECHAAMCCSSGFACFVSTFRIMMVHALSDLRPQFPPTPIDESMNVRACVCGAANPSTLRLQW